MRERLQDRRAGFRRWLTAITLAGIAFEILAGHLHGLLLQGPAHAPSTVQILASTLVLLPAVAAVVALWPGWRQDPVGPLDADVALLGQVALVTLLVGAGIHLAISWEKGPSVPGLFGLLLPLIRHGPPVMAPLLAAALIALILRTVSLAGMRLPDQEGLPLFALACLGVAASAALDHGRIGFKPLPWTVLAPGIGLLTAAWALRLAQLGRGPRGRATRRGLIVLLFLAGVIGLIGIGFHAVADLAHHPSIPVLGRFLVSPPAAAPALLTLLSLWGLYLVTGRDSLLWWAEEPRPRSDGRGPGV